MTTKEEEKKINVEYGHRISHFYIRINANLHVDGHERTALIKEWIWMVKQINEDLKRDYIPRKVVEDELKFQKCIKENSGKITTVITNSKIQILKKILGEEQ